MVPEVSHSGDDVAAAFGKRSYSESRSLTGCGTS